MASNTTNNGVTFNGLLFVAFLVLKLTDVIDWSWWWITAPLWMPLAIFVLLVCVLVVASYILKTPIKVTKRSK